MTDMDHHGPDPTQRTLETAQRELAQLERRLLDRLEAIEKWGLHRHTTPISEGASERKPP